MELTPVTTVRILTATDNRPMSDAFRIPMAVVWWEHTRKDDGGDRISWTPALVY